MRSRNFWSRIAINCTNWINLADAVGDGERMHLRSEKTCCPNVVSGRIS